MHTVVSLDWKERFSNSQPVHRNMLIDIRALFHKKSILLGSEEQVKWLCRHFDQGLSPFWSLSATPIKEEVHPVRNSVSSAG